MFKIADDDRSLTLDWNEFWKAFNDYRIEISDDDLRMLFQTFDANQDGNVNFDEFLRELVGEMNTYRKDMVSRAFAKFDRDGSGVIDKQDITGVYDASQHPAVRDGTKSEEEVLTDFLDTFEIHASMRGSAHDHRITLAEFQEYYNNVSANIDNDEYFALMITNAWKLDTAS